MDTGGHARTKRSESGGFCRTRLAKNSYTLFITASLIPHVLCIPRDEAFIGYTEKQGSRVVMQTDVGQIPILLMRKNAPETTKMVHTLATKGPTCSGCRFYRNEDRPPPGHLGPPYGLLQGSLADLDDIPPREGNIVARRGHVCMIPSTKEFFISTSDHSEWGTAHTVWGEVEDISTVLDIVNSPYHEIVHPDFGTKMRMLDTEVPFQILIQHN